MNSAQEGKILRFLSEFVYGGMDGLVTTFSVVTGAAAANVSPRIIIILGLANLFADGFSMSVGSYLAAKSEDSGSQSKAPWQKALATFCAFVILGSIPLWLYVWSYVMNDTQISIWWVSGVTALGFIIIGLVKSRVSKRNWLMEIGVTLLLGAVAATVAYGVGYFLEQTL